MGGRNAGARRHPDGKAAGFSPPSSSPATWCPGARRRRPGVDPKGERRDHRQVLANGGVAALVAAARPARSRRSGSGSSPRPSPAAAADTWATAFGARSRTPPRLILGGGAGAARAPAVESHRSASAGGAGRRAAGRGGGRPRRPRSRAASGRGADRFRRNAARLRAGRGGPGTVPLRRLRRAERVAACTAAAGADDPRGRSRMAGQRRREPHRRGGGRARRLGGLGLALSCS